MFLCWRGLDSNAFMSAAEKAIASHLPDFPVSVEDAPGQFGPASRERLAGILAAAQWQAIAVDALDLPCRFPAQHLPAYATQMGAYGRMRKTLDDSVRAQIDKIAISALQPFVSGADVRLTAALWRVTARA